MARYGLKRLEIHSETELPEVELDPTDRILSAESSLVGGHATFRLLVATPIPDPAENGQR